MLQEQVNLLVVDDDARNLMALEAVLEPLQQRIFKASSGTEALRLLLQHEFAAIVLDVKMPEMDGFECARLIREREKSARTPIIFLTGMDEGAPPEFHAYEVGAVDYLIKPVEPSILCGKLQVFVELALKTREVQRVGEELRATQQQAHERELLERQRAAAIEQQRWLESVLDTLPMALVLLDEGSNSPRFANYAACTFAGGVFTGQPWPATLKLRDGDGVALTPETLPVARTARKEKLNAELIEYEFAHQTGALLVFSERIPALHGNPATTLLILQDISVLKRTEDELRAALRSREDFLAVGSHELRTPITALKFQVRNAIKSWERPGTIENPVAHALAYLRQVQQSVDRLARLSDYLLDLSRLSSSELHLQRTLTDLEEVARAAILRPSPDGAWPTAPATVQVNGNMHGFWDRTRLEQILANLIDNARKYAPGPLEIELSGEPETVTFSVRDHGPGVKPEEIPRLFARFARAQAPDDTRGFGLGLWIVSQLAEHHGGTVHAEHPEDGGARFVVKLPRGTPAIRSSETPVPQPAPLP